MDGKTVFLIWIVGAVVVTAWEAWLLPKIARDQRLAYAAANKGQGDRLTNAARHIMSFGAASAAALMIVCFLVWPVLLLKVPRTLWRVRRELPRLFS